MSEERFSNDELIERFIDGDLDAQDTARAERLVAEHAGYREAVERSRAIDGRVRRVFSRSDAPDLRAFVLEHVDAAPSTGSATRGRERLTWIGLAAAVALAVGAVGFQAWINRSTSPPVAVHNPELEPRAVYMRMSDIGFEPEWVCADDAAFASAVEGQLGQAMLITPAPGVRVVGWQSLRYLGEVNEYLIQREEMILLSEVNGEHVVTVVAQRASDRRVPEIDPGSGLHVFRREIQGLVLYEISPLDKPGVMQHAFVPAPDEAVKE